MLFTTKTNVSNGLLLAGAFALLCFWNDASANFQGEGKGRSPEAEAGPRRSAEAEAGPRRSPEAERGPNRGGEAGGNRAANNPLRNFRPQTQREKELFQMLLQLQAEMAQLRREINQETGNAGGERGRTSPRGEGGTVARPLAPGWERTKAGGVFKAYDKNRDQFVSLEEWLAMTNGNISAARRELQTTRFRETGPGADDKLSPAEFTAWWNAKNGAQPARRAGGGEGGRSAEGEAGPRRSPERD